MSDAGAKTGVSAALDTALEAVSPDALLPLRPVEQLSLLAEKTADGEVPDIDSMGAIISQHRAPGRPKGAKNKSTEQMRTFLLSQYTHPLVVLMQYASRPLALLAAELKCDLVDAAKIQLAAANNVAPYVAQKMPQALELQADTPLGLGFLLGGDIASKAIAGGAAGLIQQLDPALAATTPKVVEQLPENNIEENQQVSEVEP